MGYSNTLKALESRNALYIKQQKTSLTFMVKSYYGILLKISLKKMQYSSVNRLTDFYDSIKTFPHRNLYAERKP